MDELAAAVDDLIASLMKNRDPYVAGTLPDVWAELDDLGLSTVAVSEECGGSGGTMADLVSVALALGRHAVSSPLIEHATASWVLARAEGALPDGVTTLAVGSAVSGERAVAAEVPWGRHADTLVWLPEGEGVHVVDLRHPSVAVTPAVNEAGEPRDTLAFDLDAARPLLGGPAAETIVNRLALLWTAALAGAVEGTYRMTREYVNTREQFGAPLVKIPAVAALLATVKADLLQVEAALSRARQRSSNELDGEAAAAAVAAARVVAARAATTAARVSHQLHGAMGITAEYPLHLHTTRLWSWRDEGGSERHFARGLGQRALRRGEDEMWRILSS